MLGDFVIPSLRPGEDYRMSVVTVTETVRQALKGNGDECSIDEVIALCPGLTWNQVFLAIDHMSRTGQIRLSMDQTRSYRVRVLLASRFRDDSAANVASSGTR